MMRDTPQLTAARIEAERSRARLMGTAHRLQARLTPATIAHNAWQSAKDKGAGLAENAVDAVRSRPLAAGGVIAAITLFLAREPLMDFAHDLASEVRGKNRKTRTTRSTEKTE